MNKRNRLLASSCMILAGITLVGFVVVPVFLPRDRVQDVARLQSVLPVLAKYRVREFQKFSSYHTLYYERGQFCSKSDLTCIINLGPAQPFDEQAEHDFAAIDAALSASGVGVDSVAAHVSDSGEVRYAEFGLTCMFCGSDRYAYSPDLTYLPDEVPNNLWHPRINEAWYLIQESWH